MVNPKIFLIWITDLNFKTISPVKIMRGLECWLLSILVLVMLNFPDDKKIMERVLLFNSRFSF